MDLNIIWIATALLNYLNSSLNSLSASKIKISKIFDWDKADFEDVIAFVNKYNSVK